MHFKRRNDVILSRIGLVHNQDIDSESPRCPWIAWKGHALITFGTWGPNQKLPSEVANRRLHGPRESRPACVQLRRQEAEITMKSKAAWWSSGCWIIYLIWVYRGSSNIFSYSPNATHCLVTASILPLRCNFRWNFCLCHIPVAFPLGEA